ncbi:sugar phosphate isomerase/epimerase family protein [Sinomonas sp. JGH33]|uniref:Sugar phosphate isomerase/epimerase family protein n=1 Tax=Sinomonas terricola TaxID=3110330 RepID=A0ABU5TBZ9_9MICC|nr:sugar phosphate isomerase/epimerase family protein [Sinomonas sp. JGH33]MEA5457062.1 sugar phosphate isomerase/epimerase family protein [Sinomonas sp. JGH33]
MLRVGVDSTKLADAKSADVQVEPARRFVERSAQLGLDGVFFRSILELSPTLDRGEIRDAVQAASDIGQRIEAGVGKVNPFATPEAPAIRALGGGDYLLAMRRMIEAAASEGIRELWTATANYQFRLSGLYACDRFRTDVDWDEQLAATEKFLRKLAPILRDAGVHLNLETHEEITTFEVIRLVEEVGPDVLGITFDSANVLVRCEDPVAAVRRAAPYIRSSHIRDVALFFRPEGIARLLRPVGEGVIDWALFLEPLIGHDLMLSIEGIVESTRGEMMAQLFDERWRGAHPDLTLPEALEVVRLASDYEARAASGDAPGWEQLHEPLGHDESLQFIERSARYLREILACLTQSPTAPLRNSASGVL